MRSASRGDVLFIWSASTIIVVVIAAAAAAASGPAGAVGLNPYSFAVPIYPVVEVRVDGVDVVCG